MVLIRTLRGRDGAPAGAGAAPPPPPSVGPGLGHPSLTSMTSSLALTCCPSSALLSASLSAPFPTSISSSSSLGSLISEGGGVDATLAAELQPRRRGHLASRLTLAVKLTPPERIAHSNHGPLAIGSMTSQKGGRGRGFAVIVSRILIVYLEVRFPTILAAFQLKMLLFPSRDSGHPIALRQHGRLVSRISFGVSWMVLLSPSALGVGTPASAAEAAAALRASSSCRCRCSSIETRRA
uniref:Uncharacterized protein n=1 Tax=Oryzias latipes TaxID=8090 RepID=A0A3P9L0S0_ORYLA